MASNPSGNIKLRVPKSLQSILKEESKKEGVSVNQLCLMLLTSGLVKDNLNKRR